LTISFLHVKKLFIKIKRSLAIIPCFLFFANPAIAQVTLDSTNLPIVAIFTYYTPIPDTPKIHAFMGIIDNGYNVTNHVTDTNFTYYGHIGIEQRGSISQAWWFAQKSYGYETRDSLGNDSDAIILDMPIESDWILYSPYDDRTLMRNVLTYDLSRQMGYYASRTRYCELLLMDFLSWNYKGVYVMMEKIKRDNDRVDIAKLDEDDNAGDSLTGGYIFAVDSNINAPEAGFNSLNQPDLFYAYKYPKGEDITPQQEAYLQAYVDSFERAAAAPNFADPVNGYRKYIVDTTFMDFLLMQELSKSVDCYKRSAYLFKDKDSNGGRLRAGPLWDFNSAWHNTSVCADYDDYTGWAILQSCWANASFPVPLWWYRILQDTTFANDVKCRWQNWRSGVLSTANIFYKMDSIADYISEAQVREYTQYGFTESFPAAVDTLKAWIANRLNWMDANMGGTCLSSGVNPAHNFDNSFSIYPNPTSGEFTIHDFKNSGYELTVYNSIGEIVLSKVSAGQLETIEFNEPPGMYLLFIKTGNSVFTKKMVKN
jgi:hypothetical protein